jgi:hypothetical protein
MYVVKTYNIFTPTYSIPDVWTKSGGSLQQVKEIYTKSGGSLIKVYNRNSPGPVGSFHPFWQYNLNSEFNFNDQGVSFGTFWSSPASGSYSISSGSCSIYVNALNLNSTTQDRTEATNTTSGSNIVVLKDATVLDPILVTNVDTGTTVKWAVSGTNIPANTFVNDRISATEIRLSNNATGSGSGLSIRYQRTYNSSYSGITRMTSNYPLSVSPGQTYTFQASPTAGTTSNCSWKMAMISAPTKAGADFFGTDSQYQESAAYFDLASNSWSVTIPSGHNWMRPMINIEHISTSYPTNMPRYYTFNWFRITRTG